MHGMPCYLPLLAIDALISRLCWCPAQLPVEPIRPCATGIWVCIMYASQATDINYAELCMHLQQLSSTRYSGRVEPDQGPVLHG